MKKIRFGRKRCCSVLGVMIAAMLVLLSGCVPQNYRQKEKREIKEKAEPMLAEYLEKKLGGGELSNLEVIVGSEADSIYYGGAYLTHVVQGEFTQGGETYHIAVNIDTETFWSDYGMPDMESVIEEQLAYYMAYFGYEGIYDIANLSFGYGQTTENVKVSYLNEPLDVECVIWNLLPETLLRKYRDTQDVTLLCGIPIIGFTLYYEMVDENYLEPKILLGYFQRTGTYFGTLPGGSRSGFRMMGLTREQVLRQDERGALTDADYLTDGWEMRLEFGDMSEDVTYSVKRRTTTEVGDFSLSYYSVSESGSLSELNPDEFEVKELPVQIEGDTIRSSGLGFENRVFVYFHEKPNYSQVLRTKFSDDTQSEPEELYMTQAFGFNTFSDEEQDSNSIYCLYGDELLEFR